MDQVQIVYNQVDENEGYEQLITKVIKECFQVEGLEKKNLYISVTLTTPEEIQILNREYRGIDRTTDVLSFPMFEKDEILMIKDKNEEYDILGDIVISVLQVEKQAKEYGHSFERELAYMLVHGFYHLMGYDHIEPQDKEQMRPKEEFVLEKLKIGR